MKAAFCFVFVGALGLMADSQAQTARPPVIDMHVHSTNTTPQKTLDRMKQLNIRYVFVSTLVADQPQWANALKRDQYATGIVFPCDHGRAPYTGSSCLASESELPDIHWLRSEIKAGHINAFGELEPQYVGMSPANPLMEPYWQLAEETDTPVGIHLGPGPPGIAYESSHLWPPVKSPKYRMSMGDPLLLEEVLVKHQHLRIYVMHAGWPRLESMIALMALYPNVYVDVAALQSESLVPRAGYYHYLRGLVEAGFAKRIMFGSDFPDSAGSGIDAILSADFLSPEQKSDILCNNAARFMRLDPSPCVAIASGN